MNKLKLFKQNFIKGKAVRVILTSFFAILACTGIIKAATTIGNNIVTGGTITSNGVNTLYGATSIGGALTATSSLSVAGATTLNSTLGVSGASTLTGALTVYGNSTLSNLTATGTLSVTGLTTLGNASTTLLSVSENMSINRINFDSVAGPTSATGLLSTATAATGGTLPGSTTYCYTMTYYTATGETDSLNDDSDGAIAPVNQTTAAGTNTNTITISGIPTSSDTQVIGRKIYRSSASCAYPNQTYLIATIANNTDTSYVDTGGVATPNANLISQHNTTGGRIYSVDGTIPVFETSAELTAVGYGAGTNNSGFDNTYIGYMSGNGVVGSSYGKANIGLGQYTLRYITSGNSNIAIGSNAGLSITGAYDSILLGSHAGDSITTGYYNIGIGFGALQAVTTAGSNVAIGDMAGYYMTGGANMCLGYNACKSQTGIWNKLYIDNTDDNYPLIGGDFSTKVINLGGSVIKQYTITTDTTDGVGTHTAAEMMGGLIIRSGITAGSATDVTDSIANIIAAIPMCESGKSGFEFSIQNQDTDSTIILDGATKVTIYPNDPATAIPANSTGRFLLQVADCTQSATPSVKIYSLGASAH